MDEESVDMQADLSMLFRRLIWPPEWLSPIPAADNTSAMKEDE